MEIFKEIKEFEDYEVSNEGNVRSLKRNIILKPIITKCYYKVGLYKDGKPYSKKIHRLVAEAFIPNPNNYKEVNHKNELKTDNRAENLEWCNREYTINYGSRTEKCSEKQSKLVVAIDDEDNVVYEFASTKEAGRNGFNSGSVSACCRKCYNTHNGNNFFKGYRWFWKSEWEEMQQATHDRVACGKLNIE